MFFLSCWADCVRQKSGMIFGFNTDIAAEGTVYHVQTEVREQERRLESQVFVQRPLHRQTLRRAACRRHRRRNSGAGAGSAPLGCGSACAEVLWTTVLSQETTEELTVQLLGSQRVSGEDVILRFRVLSGGYVAGSGTGGRKLEDRVGRRCAGERTLTNDAGVAEMRLELADGAAELEVRARLEGRETTRRFLVKSARA